MSLSGGRIPLSAGRSLGRRAAWLIAPALLAAVLLALRAAPDVAATLRQALESAEQARPLWLVAAAAGFTGGLVASAGAWRSAIRACGGRTGIVDACARYGVGSLVNSLTPARIGDAVRVGAYSRLLPGEHPFWAAGGAWAAISVAQLGWFALVASAAALVAGQSPLPAAALGAAMAVSALLMATLGRRVALRRLAELLAVVRSMRAQPALARTLLAWTGAATLLRLGAAVSVALAFALPSPLVAALLTAAVIGIVSGFPLTPGNVGVTSGAIALALHGEGVALPTAIAAGVAYHAVETAVGLSFGGASALLLGSMTAPALSRRLVLSGCAAAACLVVAIAAGTSFGFD